jgi:hypothetical protein
MLERFFLLALAITTLSVVPLYSQAPMPVVTPVTTKAPSQASSVAIPAANDASATNLKMLRDLKAANEETISKQKAALEKLDEMQKAADQIKLYSKRT